MSLILLQRKSSYMENNQQIRGEFKLNVECNHATLFGHRLSVDGQDFFTSYDKVYESFDSMGLQENPLRGFYAYGGSHPLSWGIRIKVAVGIAKGLSFLHDAESQIIYRDVKASNMLLDTFNAKFSDFGLAKAGPTGNKTHVSTRVMGTQGYAAPE